MRARDRERALDLKKRHTPRVRALMHNKSLNPNLRLLARRRERMALESYKLGPGGLSSWDAGCGDVWGL